MQAKSRRLDTFQVGALPLIQAVLNALQLQPLLAADRTLAAYAAPLAALVKSLLLQPNALYRIESWRQDHAADWVGAASLSDDVLGRALDRLFEADRGSLLTRLATRAIQHFQLDTQQLHHDTTSVRLCGAYAHQWPTAVQLRRGFSKEHRPDLKQLIYALTITADGAIPLHFRCCDGNRTDDTLHWDTWQTLARWLQDPSFLYVADCKLCVKETLLQIDQAHGRFVTVLPRTRAEQTEFAEACVANRVRWGGLWRRRSPRHNGRWDEFDLAQEFHQSREGFRLFWFRSSEKRRRDAEDREQRLATALEKLEHLNQPKRRGPKKQAARSRAAEQILVKYRVQPWITVQLQAQQTEQFRQTRRGRPNAQATYKRVLKTTWQVVPQKNLPALAQAHVTDGVFPLITNTQLTALQTLKAYKFQPCLEKRHALFKTLLEVAPVFLKKNTRIEAFIFVYFLAQMVASLLERALRSGMARHGVKTLGILPEGRPSAAPSAAQILETFASRAQHVLWENGARVETFVAPLRNVEAQLLHLLNLPADLYHNPAYATDPSFILNA